MSELGSLFLDKSSLHIIAWDLDVERSTTLYQEQTVFGKMKMDPGKRAQTQNAGEVSSLDWFFSQSVELMTDKVWLLFIRPMLLK